ncbi:tyrosine-type recombinase/integrase [Streptomyces decoyicus]|uniref:tyrosine-type recombinase/integrase n=2 Tax=Streptomyces TaxID=1883 RepID=UPI0038701E21|nr:site-specific integrase [Streptomyces decoyicus]
MPDLARPTTGVSRRHTHTGDEPAFASRFASSQIEAQPALATTVPRPFGDLSAATPQLIGQLAHDASPAAAAPTAAQHRASTRRVLAYLAGFEGSTWQQRWDASHLGHGEITAAELGTNRTGQKYSVGVRALFCLRVVQPTLLVMKKHHFNGFADQFIAAQNDPLLEQYAAQVAHHDFSWPHKREALFDVCCLLAVQGIGFGDLTPAALLHHAHASRTAKAALRPGKKDANVFAGHAAWNVLHAMAHFPASTPATLRQALHRGQLTLDELVDRHTIRNQGVRRLLVDYFHRRKADTDYASLVNLVRNVAHHFWARIEAINPEQSDMNIPADLYSTWRQQIGVRHDGKPRIGVDTIVIAVRSFYYDLHTWAADEPERWAPWVASCPVPPSELRGLAKRRRRINERSADRTRLRQPLLPFLVRHVEARYDHTRTLLEHASAAATDTPFTHGDRTYRRVLTEEDLTLARGGHRTPVRVRDDTGQLVQIEAEEETAFWDWATVETLRHSGARIEEMCEVSHLSIRHYQRSNGEMVALLVISPSKTDRERVIPMSAELFHVIASVIRRHTRDGNSVPILRRFDPHDKVWSPPMPFLFQRKIGSTRSVISPVTVLNMLARRCTDLAEHHPAFRSVKFTPHDFRRIFTTELVNSGLPIHIGAMLLGHLNIQTTRGYVAVFDEDVIRHYLAHLNERRQLRPDHEYRDVTSDEWDEFEEHFDKRKVELGACGRPYGTPCQHEHACIRCPMLQVSPKMISRLDDLEADLITRRVRAKTEGWAGEIEGLDLTLQLLRAKRDDTQRRAQRPLVDLGIPAPRMKTEDQ